MNYGIRSIWIKILLVFAIYGCEQQHPKIQWTINSQEYLEKPGLNVLAFHDFYPGGKQGGIEIIQHGDRIASNGFIMMESVNGKSLNEPETAVREIDSVNKVIKTTVDYKDYDFKYTIRIWPDGDNIKLAVDLAKPLPVEWENNLSFQLEFYTPAYYGKSYQLGKSFGIITRQPDGPKVKNDNGHYVAAPLAEGKILTLAGEDPLKKIVVEDAKGELVMIDERNNSNRGWILVKSNVPSGATENAVEWTIKPNVIPGWKRTPVIEVSQVGYDPGQVKQAIIELDPNDQQAIKASLVKVGADGSQSEEVFSAVPENWGKFLRYDYKVFDFTTVKDPGMYMVKYGDQESNPFAISQSVYKKEVWQPTLEAYFPIQMCHVLVRDRSAIWHGACHLDDALQAPLDSIHVDGYQQYAEAETSYKSMTTVPYLNQGGWHDAGDDDLAAGSQAATTQFLVLAHEICKDHPDQTYVNFADRYVEMRRPDGIPDFVQQIKQGALNLLSGYRVAGHSFVGIIDNAERRNITGDWALQSGQLFYDGKLNSKQKTLTHSGINDDRWVFTNRNTGLEEL